MRYTLRQLEVFQAAAHHENISRAADSLSMSQSAASGALKDLETQFDVRLFDRVGKRLQLNEQGRLLWSQVEALLEQASALEQQLLQHSQIGSLKVGATLTIGNYLAVAIMAQMMSDYPQAKISLQVANTRAIAEQVLHFELDIGLIEGELHHADLDVIPWCDDELVVFAAPNHPLCRQREPVSDQQLKELDWIIRESGSGTRQTFDRAMHGILSALHIKLELQHTEAIKRAVEAELGVGCLSKVALKEAFKRRSLLPLSVPQRDFSRKFYFIVHRQKYRTAGMEHWIRLCQEQLSLM